MFPGKLQLRHTQSVPPQITNYSISLHFKSATGEIVHTISGIMVNVKKPGLMKAIIVEWVEIKKLIDKEGATGLRLVH